MIRDGYIFPLVRMIEIGRFAEHSHSRRRMAVLTAPSWWKDSSARGEGMASGSVEDRRGRRAFLGRVYSSRLVPVLFITDEPSASKEKSSWRREAQ